MVLGFVNCCGVKRCSCTCNSSISSINSSLACDRGTVFLAALAWEGPASKDTSGLHWRYLSHSWYETNSFNFFFRDNTMGFVFVGSLVLLFCGVFLSFCWYPLYTSIIFNISCFLFVLSLSISVPGFYSQCRQPELHQTDNEDTWIKCATGYFILLFILGTTTKIPKEAYTSMWKIWVFCNKLIFNYYLGTPLKFYFLSILDF